MNMKRIAALWLIAVACFWGADLARAQDKSVNYDPGTSTLKTISQAIDHELGELYHRSTIFCTVGGTANAIECTSPNANMTSPRVGDSITLIASGNSTGAVTINVDGTGFVSAANPAGSNLGNGDISSGTMYTFVYASGPKWRLDVGGASGGGGGGAAVGADYLQLSNNGTNTAERVFTPGIGLGATDGGANSTYTLNITDAELTAILGLTSAADRLPYFTGSGTASLATFTSFGRSFVDDANAAAGWATLTGDELAQDAVGTILADGTFIDFTYSDGTPSITATIIGDSLTASEIAADAITASELANNAVDTAAIVDANVTLAKIANIATDSLIGRDTASSGAPENILLNATLSMDGSGNLQRAALTGDVTASAGSNATTIAADAVALSTDTTGNYVGTVAGGTGIAVSGADSENATKTVAFDFTDAGASPSLGANECRFSSPATVAGVIVCEGATANTSESRIVFTDPTADRAMTIPNADSNPIQPAACNGTDKVSGISSSGVISCAADEGGSGSGDNIRVEDGNGDGTFTAADNADFADGGDINFILDTGTSPDQITAEIKPDAIALGTDTTGNYVATVADGTGIDGSVSSEGGTYTPTLDLTEINTFTLGAGSATGIIFDAGATDPAIEVGSGTFTIDIGGTDETLLTASAYSPGANDGNALGTSSLRWADLFMADGAVIDMGASGSRATITHVAASDSITIAADPDAATASSAINLSVDGNNEAILNATNFTPGANDGNALGASGTAWADLFLASGGLIEMDGGTSNTFTCTGGNCSIEGNGLYRAGGTDVALADGGTGASLSDPNADRIMWWDESDNALELTSLIDLGTEGSPASGDFLLLVDNTGALFKVNWSSLPGSGGGDSITVNTTAVTDPDFDNSLPAAAAGGVNVKWQTASNDISAYLDVIGLTDLTAVDVADSFMIVDASATNAVKEATVGEVFKSVNSFTEDTAPSMANDFVPTYDASASAAKKVKLARIGAGLKSIALLAGAGTIPSGGGIAGCTAVAAFDSGSNDVFMRQCSFSAGTDNAIYWTIPAPKSSDETVDWQLRIDWTSATTTDGTDNVIWTASAVCFSNDDAINGNAFPAVDTVTDTQTAAGDFLSTSNITTITPAGTWAEGDACVLRVTRDADNASDNFNGTAELINAMLFITTNANTDD